MINLVHFYVLPGGIELLLPGIVKASRPMEFSAFVIRPPSNKSLSVYNTTDIAITYGSRSNISASVKLARYAKLHRQEIFHVFNIGPLFLLVLRISGVKRLIYSVHGTVYWHSRIEKWLLKILWWMAIDRKRHLFTANSFYSSKIFREKINQGVKCEVLYNYMDTGRFGYKGDISGHHKPIRIIYAGRLSRGKGLEKWIEVATGLHGLMPEMEFEVYGEGELQETLCQRISDLDAGGYIKLRGYRADIENAFRESDLLLFLSEFESFGNVVVESIMCGTPVLTTDIPSLREIFDDFPEFILNSHPPSADEIARKLDQYPLLARKTAEAAVIFRDRFSMNRHLEKLKVLYARV